jgi:hypothetical protein
MTRRKPLLLLGILAVALGVAAGVGYPLLHREPVYGGKPRTYWKHYLASAEYRMVPPPGWLQGLVWKVNPWKSPTLTRMTYMDTCEASFDLLVQMLTDPDPVLRQLVLFTLWTTYGDSPEAWPVYLRATRDPHEDVREQAFKGLEMFRGDWTPAMVEDYLALLSDRDPRVRVMAGSSLTRRPQGREAVARALQQRAKTRTLNADEASLLQEAEKTSRAARPGPSP